MKLLIFLNKILFHVGRLVLGIVEKIDTRIYMRFYIMLLEGFGLTLIGLPRYISLKVRFDDLRSIELGERVVISENVVFLTHDYSLTTALISINKAPATDIAFLKKIKIGNNVFIGMNSLISPGASIGDNVIVGAGTIVRGCIPENSIVIGNPGIVIGRLTDKAIKWEALLNDNANINLRID